LAPCPIPSWPADWGAPVVPSNSSVIGRASQVLSAGRACKQVAHLLGAGSVGVVHVVADQPHPGPPLRGEGEDPRSARWAQTLDVRSASGGRPWRPEEWRAFAQGYRMSRLQRCWSAGGLRHCEWRWCGSKTVGMAWGMARLGCPKYAVDQARKAFHIPSPRPVRTWTPEEDALLGTMPDAKLAVRLYCGALAMRQRREALGRFGCLRGSAGNRRY